MSIESGGRAAVALLAVALAACSVLPPGPAVSEIGAPAGSTAGNAANAATVVATPAAPAAGPLAAPPAAAALRLLPAAPVAETRESAAAAAALELLSYHERVREMSASELAREAARLGDPPSGPRAALSLAIVLAQTHNPGDLMRALALVEPIARSAHPAVLPWQPFARWLAARYAEQRRLEDQLERQAQQLREQQRRLDQLNEKLTALRAIERSLGRGSSGGNRAPLPSPGASK